jgi:hypothetical protein
MASAEESRSAQATDKKVNNSSNSFFFYLYFYSFFEERNSRHYESIVLHFSILAISIALATLQKDPQFYEENC